MKRVLSGILAAMLTIGSASASELVTTADDAGTPPLRTAGAAPLGVQPVSRSALDDRPQPRPTASTCPPASDGKMHGEVWAGVGTHGYRDVGAAVTGPIGRCGALSIAVSRTQGAFGRWGR